MTKKWIVGLLVVAMLFSFAGVIGANQGGQERPGGGPPFEVPPVEVPPEFPPEHQVRETVTEGVYKGPTVTEGVYMVGRHGRVPAHVWARWQELGVGPPGSVLDMMKAKFRTIDAGQVTVGGNPFKTDVPPIVRNGRTLVPVRAIAETFGATVSWDQEMFLVTIEDGETTILLKIGANEYVVNDKVREMDTGAYLFKDRTVLPLRVVAEALGHDVHWDAATDRITIN